ncbi:MAG: bifunctional folylpolyglutamate synthase/dihydrofolate synthase [Papillibacter sp.]|nr:bifunctional folylpolyglutamate synthase/dihydrofolate synthase [Papillibacter sp.]
MFTYQEALDYILGTPNPGSVYERNVINTLLKELGDPQKGMKYVHIAGTNGKGSTSAFMASILRCAGYRTGLYTSPYIQRFNERIQVNGEQIPDEAIAEITTEIAAATERVQAQGYRRPTIFELITALGFVWFKRSRCEIVVLEVGMGGRLDATNSIDESEVAAIVNIGFDHMEFLGDTLPLIAGEKAGIIKQGGNVVLYAQSEEVENVIKKACADKNASLRISDSSLALIKSYDLDGIVFDFGPYKDLHISLLGSYQVRNACTSVTITEALREKGWNISDKALYEGLKKAHWPGRLELLQREPVVIVDGAHNPQGVEALMEAMSLLFPEKKLNIVIAVLADKDYASSIEIAKPHAKKFYTVSPPSYRALSSEQLADEIHHHSSVPVDAFDSIPAALRSALAESKNDDVICIFGSLYQVGEIRTYFGRSSF